MAGSMAAPRLEPESLLRAGRSPTGAGGVGPVVIEIWSPTCVECRAMQSDLDAVAADYSDRVDLQLVNAYDGLETVRTLGVKGTPTLIGVRAGEEVFRMIGRRSRSELEALFEVVASGEGAPEVGNGDLWLRLGAGVVLVGAGLGSGPVWELVLIGVSILTLGVVSWLRR